MSRRYNDNNSQQRRRNDGECSSSGLGTILMTAGAAVVGGLVGWYLSENSPSRSRSACSHRTPGRNRDTLSMPPRHIEEDEPVNSPERRKECIICLKSFDFIKDRGGEVHMTPCGHLFCLYCIDQSLARNPECPVCRRKVARDDTLQVYI